MFNQGDAVRGRTADRGGCAIADNRNQRNWSEERTITKVDPVQVGGETMRRETRNRQIGGEQG